MTVNLKSVCNSRMMGLKIILMGLPPCVAWTHQIPQIPANLLINPFCNKILCFDPRFSVTNILHLRSKQNAINTDMILLLTDFVESCTMHSDENEFKEEVGVERMMISEGEEGANLELEGRTAASGTFTVLSYNVLSDLYATSDMYNYCPPWALSWPYRRQNLLREIVGYQADILCLQEVQSDHFEEFFAPELEKHGYTVVYKKKTTEVYTGTAYAIDGCATFFRRDRFALVKKYEVEFNKAAQSLTEAVVPSAQKKAALSRLLKDNVALIVVLEANDTNHGINALATGKVEPSHPDLTTDPLGILRPASKLCH